MKKFLLMIIVSGIIASGASAQQKGTLNKEKVSKTSTLPQKVHNTFSKHKKYSGIKIKRKIDKPTSTK